MHWIRRGLCIVAAMLLALPASAHPVPFSYLDVRLQPSSLDVALTIHIYDLAHDLQVTPMERLLESGFLSSQLPAIRALVTPRLQLSADGGCWSQIGRPTLKFWWNGNPFDFICVIPFPNRRVLYLFRL